MYYPVVIHKDPDSDYGVTVPDLPGCFSAGDSIEDALIQVVEAIECHVEGLLLDQEPIPMPQNIEYHRLHPNYVDGIWALVAVDFAKLSGKAAEVQVTLPEGVIALMDAYALQHGETRNDLIAKATSEFITKQITLQES